MFHIGTDSQLLVAIRLVQPVLSLDVVGLFLSIAEDGCGEAERSFAKHTGSTNGSEERLELVFLLAVEIDLEALHVLKRSELGLTVSGLEVVVVAIDIDDSVEGPVLCWCPAEIRLIIEEVGLVLAFRLEAAQHVLVGLVAQSIAEGELLLAVTDINVCAKQTGCNRGFEPFGVGIGDVKHARHLVAIFRLESTSREVNLLHHIAIDDGKSLLLSAIDEHRPVNLDAIDIDAVLVERAATNVVLAAQLVMGADASLGCHKLFDGIAARRGHSLQVLLVEFLHRTHLSARFCNGHLLHLFPALSHHDVERQIAFGFLEDTLARLVAHHGVNDHDAIGSIEG